MNHPPSTPNEVEFKQKAAKRRARCPKVNVPLLERAAITPNEFAALFGKETTWGYRQIYAGRVSVIKTLGHQMIPRSEIQRLMGSAALVTAAA